MVTRALRATLATLLLTGLVFHPAPAKAQLQVCYVGDQQGFYDSASDSCVISDPWPDGQPGQPNEPVNGQLGSCQITPDGCEFVCLTYSRDNHQYNLPWIVLQEECY